MVQVLKKGWVFSLTGIRLPVKNAGCRSGTSHFQQVSQVTAMQTMTHQKSQSAVLTNQWLWRVCTTGFVFFLAKGLVWLAVAVWVIY